MTQPKGPIGKDREACFASSLRVDFHQMQHEETGQWQDTVLPALLTHGVHGDSVILESELTLLFFFWGFLISPTAAVFSKGPSAHQKRPMMSSVDKYLQSPTFYTWS